VQECERLAIEILPIFGQAPASVEPRDGAFDDPSLGQHDEGMQFVALDDFDDPVAALRSCQCSARAPITGIGEDAYDEREQNPRLLVEDEGGPRRDPGYRPNEPRRSTTGRAYLPECGASCP
jgi:hypothetical protein